MNLVDSDGMRMIDRRAQEEYGIPALLLMESAGLLAWMDLKARLGAGIPAICAVAGRGNNGGDALVMARYAILDGFPVTVVLSGADDSLGELCGLHAAIVRRLGARTLRWDSDEDACRDAIAGAAVVVDGLAGTGIKGALRAPLDAICDAINASTARVAAVDAPSGLGDGWRPGMPVVDADVTLTMGLPKTCLYGPPGRLHCGEIRRIDLSFPSALVNDPGLPGTFLEPGDLAQLLVPLEPDAYKHQRGVVAVFAGAMGTTGAAILAADAAARCRAGMVTIYADPEIYPVVAPAVRSIMVRRFEPGSDITTNADAAVIGPGWGVSEQRKAQLEAIVSALPRGVIDADGLNLIARMTAAGEPTHLHDAWVLTPHPGEIARLLDTDSKSVLEDFIGAVTTVARRTGAVVIGKSSTTVLAHPDGRFAVADGMNPAMGTGGTGDVLAGAVAGLLAGGMDSWSAACAGVLVHQQAGARLRERVGLFLAEQLPAEIGRIVDVRGSQSW